MFGPPLETWRTAMPKGMLLKSDGFASNLSVPLPDSTLEDYCREHGLAYHATDIPVPVETFIDYGLDFQRRFVPQLEPGMITSVEAGSAGRYRVTRSDGEEIEARHVVVAAGITHFAKLPAAFDGIGSDLVTHASVHHDLADLAGKDVTVVGAGASAVELAVGVAAAGGHARLVARTPPVKFAGKPSGHPKGRWERVRNPTSGLGPGVKSRLCCDVPQLFRFLPTRARAEIVRRHLGPSSPWHLRPKFESSVELVEGRGIRRVDVDGSRLHLELAGDGLAPVAVETDHVICATGYRADLRRLTFIDPALRAKVKTVNDAPALNFGFESSEHGLYFAGIAAAMTFGPLMRFMYGDAFAAEHITDRIAKSSS